MKTRRCLQTGRAGVLPSCCLNESKIPALKPNQPEPIGNSEEAKR